ncbi:MAG: polyprenyl synthetase family protein, partial [Alphaproteobacteria bacterium]|nr:polyprenyl synthetase family protein [Alphaproteobacteria bacterium]
EQTFWRRTIEELDQHDGDLDRAKDLIAKYDALAGTVEAAERYGKKAFDALARLETTSGVAQDIREALEDVIEFCIVRGH